MWILGLKGLYQVTLVCGLYCECQPRKHAKFLCSLRCYSLSFFFQWLEEGSYISLTWKLTDRKLVITFNLFMKKSLMSDSERQKLISKSCDVTLKAACKEIHA